MIDYDSDSPTEESRRFRRELLERVRQELFATAEREPGLVEQRLLRQVASIIRRCENDLLESFHAPPGTQPSPLPASRRTSGMPDSSNDGAPPTCIQVQPIDMDPRQPVHLVPPAEPVSPGGHVQNMGAPLPPGEGFDLGIFSNDWMIDWNITFPPGPEAQGVEREDAFMPLSASVWTR